MVVGFLSPDGKSFWQPSRDAGLPESFPADPGGEDQFLPQLPHARDPCAIQGGHAKHGFHSYSRL